MCTLADGSDAAVVALKGGVGHAVACPGDDAVDMAHQHVVEVDERSDPRPVEQGAPSAEERAHPLLGGVGPGVLELLLEQVGLEQAAVHDQQRHELAAAPAREAPVLGQEQPLLAADRVAVGAAAPEELPSANLLDRLGQVALDVEPVEHDVGQGCVGLDRTDVALPHVHGDYAKAPTASAPELGEERVEGVALAAFADPDHAGPGVVPDDSQELALAAAVADLVDTDDPQRLAELACRRLLDPALDEPHYAGPVQPELATPPRDRTVASSLQDLSLEQVGEPRPGPRPRHLLDTNAAVTTANAARHRPHDRRCIPEVGVSPRPGWLDVVDAGFGLAAARADRRGPRRLEVYDHSLGFARRRSDAPALGREQLLGQDAEEHPSDSFLCLHTPGRTRSGARSPLPVWPAHWRGRAYPALAIQALRHAPRRCQGAPQAPSAASLPFDSVIGAWHLGLPPTSANDSSPERAMTQKSFWICASADRLERCPRP